MNRGRNARPRARSHTPPRAAACAAALLAGCAMHVYPPAQPAEPELVFISDYGYHSSLVLPAESGELVEFAYGHYGWFAQNHDAWYDAIALTLFPGQGTLGRRTLPAPAGQEPPAIGGAEAIHPLRVERALVDALRRELQDSFDRAGEDVIDNPAVGLRFVRYPRLYTHLHNCNSATAEWLEALGCRVAGSRTVADFIIEPARP